MSDAEGSEEEEEEKLDPAVLVSDFYAACKAGDATQATELLEYDVPAASFKLLRQKPVPNYDSSKYASRRVQVTARDGESVT